MSVFPSPVMCVMDSEGSMFSTDERANAVLTIKTSGETVGVWGESGTGPGRLNGPVGDSAQPRRDALDRQLPATIESSISREMASISEGFGEFGTEPGQLNYPWGISFDAVERHVGRR